jgi:septum formation protein
METVGGYKVEGRGVQLFEKMTGDYFAVLGLPLFPLLAFLRTQAVIAA